MPKLALPWVLVLVAGTLLVTSTLKSQAQTASRAVWEYARVTEYSVVTQPNGEGFSNAEICYAAASGCRREGVHSTHTEALMEAANTLGAQGWEMTAVTEPPNPNGHKMIYFRRLQNPSR